MYIGIILLISIFIGIKKSFRFNFKVRCRLISVTLILTLLVLIVSGLNVKYDGDSKSNYLPGIFKSDSERYLKETKVVKDADKLEKATYTLEKIDRRIKTIKPCSVYVS